MPRATLAGLDDANANATVRHRRTKRAWVSAAAAVVVIATVATFALSRGLGGGPDGVATDPAVTTSPPGAQMRFLQDRRKPTPLDGARLALPDFHHDYCPTGQTQFRGGLWTGPGVPDFFVAEASIGEVVEGDLNGDGEAERVALVRCDAGTDPGAYAAQVVAFTQQGATLGQVTWAAGGQLYLTRVELIDGKVRVLHVSRPDAGPPTALEWRSFSWNGNEFVPAGTSGVELDLRPSQLAVTAEPVRLSADGRGTLIVRVTNNGGPALDEVSISMSSPLPLTLALNGKPLWRFQISADQPYEWAFKVAGVQPGSTVTGTFEVSAHPAAALGNGQLSVAAVGVGIGLLPLENVDGSNQIDITITL